MIVFFVDDDEHIQIYETETGAVIEDFPFGHFRLSPDGQYFALWEYSGSELHVQVFPNISKYVLTKFGVIDDIEIDPTSNTFFLRQHNSPDLQVYQLDTGTLTHNLVHDTNVQFAAWNKDGTRMLTTSDDGIVHIWDTASWLETLTIDRQYNFPRPTWSPDERFIMIADSHSSGLGKECEERILNYVAVWDSTTGSQLLSLEYEGFTSGIWHPDSEHIVTATSVENCDVLGGFVTDFEIWDVLSHQKLDAFRQVRGGASDTDLSLWTDWSVDGKRLLTSTAGSINIWEISLE